MTESIPLKIPQSLGEFAFLLVGPHKPRETNKALNLQSRLNDWRIEILVTVVAILVTVIVVFVHIEPRLIQTRVGNSTLVSFEIRLNQANLDKVDPTSMVIVGSGVLATIFAIVFGLSQILVSNVAERYSPRMVDMLGRSRRYWLPVALYSASTVLFFSLLALVHISQGVIGLSMMITSIGLFTIAILALIRYLKFFQLAVTPARFVKVIELNLMKVLSTRGHVKEDEVASLADAAIKALIRGGEQENAIAFLLSFHSIIMTSLKNGKFPSPIIFDTVLAGYMNQLLRVYQEAANRRESAITSLISTEMHKIAGLLYGNVLPRSRFNV